MRFLAFSLVVVVALFAGMSDRGSADEESASIWIQPSVASVRSTDTTFLDIMSDIPSPGAVEWWLDVNYDPDVLFPGYCVSTGDQATNGAGCHLMTRGTVRASGYVPAGLSGRHKLARIPFTAIAPSGNQTEITIVPAKFIGPNESPLPAETFGGLVQVDGIGTNSLVVGVMFSDEDADGHKEDGELGLYREVRLTSGSFFRSDGTRGDGSYLITGGTPGNYTLQAMLNELVGGICSDGPGSFDPLWHIGCTSGIEIEWEATTPQPVSVLLEPGVVARVDFGARRRDQQSVRGGALLRTGHAPNGTLVQAWANNTLCGEAATATVGSNYNFIVEVMGNRERPGCANDGDIVTFTVDGAAASQTLLWGSEPAYSEIDLIAIPDHAWLWVEQPAPLEPSSVGTAVVAIVDGKACATTTIARTNQGFMPGPPPIGFTQLAVPSDTLAPGCGAAGKVVSFRIGVEMSAFTTTWQPGLHRIDLPLPGMGKAGDDDCNGAVDAGDALGILRWVATQGYFGVDCRIPTDVNCDGSRSAVDALHILRFVAGLPSRVPEGCPGVGA